MAQIIGLMNEHNQDAKNALIDKELDDITSKRSAASNDVEIDILDRQYRTRMKEYKEIYKEIENLKE